MKKERGREADQPAAGAPAGDIAWAEERGRRKVKRHKSAAGAHRRPEKECRVLGVTSRVLCEGREGLVRAWVNRGKGRGDLVKRTPLG